MTMLSRSRVMPKMVKRRVKIKRPSSGKKPYFTKDTQEAIESFCKSECYDFRNKVYNESIKPALEKLAENLIFIYGFHKQFDDIDLLKHNCVINLYETLHKFDHTRNKKAFSYFNVVGKHWLIVQARKAKKYKDRNISINSGDENFNFESLLLKAGKEIKMPDHNMIIEQNKATTNDMLFAIRKKVKSDAEIRCIEAIIKIFESIDELDFLNKRAIFVYVREISGLNSKQLSTCMSSIRRIYRDIAGPGKEFDIL